MNKRKILLCLINFFTVIVLAAAHSAVAMDEPEALNFGQRWQNKTSYPEFFSRSHHSSGGFAADFFNLPTLSEMFSQLYENCGYCMLIHQNIPKFSGFHLGNRQELHDLLKEFGKVFSIKIQRTFYKQNISLDDHIDVETYYRKIPVTVEGSNSQFNPAAQNLEDVTGQMTDFIEELYIRMEGGEAAVSTAAWALHRFVQIHPFLDGNGRASRLLMNMILVDSGLSAIVLSPDASEDAVYIQALEAADKGDRAGLENLINTKLEMEVELEDGFVPQYDEIPENWLTHRN